MHGFGHGFDDVVVIVIAKRARQDNCPIAQNTNDAAYFANFAQLVRNKEDANALCLKLADAIKQRVCFVRGQGGRRFIKNKDAGLANQPAHDFNNLAVGNFKGGGLRIKIKRYGKIAQQGFCLCPQRARFGLKTKTDIFQNRLVGQDVGFLGDQIKPKGLCRRRGRGA